MIGGMHHQALAGARSEANEHPERGFDCWDRGRSAAGYRDVRAGTDVGHGFARKLWQPSSAADGSMSSGPPVHVQSGESLTSNRRRNDVLELPDRGHVAVPDSLAAPARATPVPLHLLVAQAV